MEKNYRVKFTHNVSKGFLITFDYEDLGQAMIRVKHFGHREKECGGHPMRYRWEITNEREDPEEGEFKKAYGYYSFHGYPSIKEITTY